MTDPASIPERVLRAFWHCPGDDRAMIAAALDALMGAEPVRVDTWDAAGARNRNVSPRDVLAGVLAREAL